ncbi:Effector of nucleoid occlusion Noc [Alteribacillus persepolensis]|uniref:Effector of nucleoid occlusion Noc n=1 Tax=Alteribacillus persepolensis TaxID=568899 RepID=A0A1G8IZH4_9BACI|nr:nucleoid occlusion protein [Alteribacillus persepolensis]SDI24212.1 Effector of nucleoid occlusion Noc [Alteribacillus persepolensis]
MKQSLQKWFGLGDQDNGKEGKDQRSEDEVKRISVDQITANPFQPRTIFQEDKIAELAQSIRTHGLLQPITVRQREDRYEIIAGERRWRAALYLQMEEIPAIIKEFNDTETASVALIENLQREELTAIEEAVAYAKLLELHNLTQESLAQRLGKGQSTVANKLRLLHLTDSVQQALKERKITERHARALLPMKDADKQEHVLEQIIKHELNVKQTEELIKKQLQGESKPKKKKPTRKHFSKDTRLALNTIRQSVDMVTESGMNVETDEEDHEEYYQFTIRIPKK